MAGSEVSAEIAVEADLKEVWETFFDPDLWRSWVDGFDKVVASDAYPETGGRLRWRSIPAGRGEVAERVVTHEPRRLHRIAFADPESEGELTTTFEIRGSAVAVTRTMDYKILRPGLLGPLTDIFFVRRQVTEALERELSGLKYESELATRE